MIKLLWPTARPAMMLQTYRHWMDMSSKTIQISLIIAVNKDDDALKLAKEFPDSQVVAVGDQRKGPVWPTHRLGQIATGNDEDIIILASDDFFSPKHWDVYVTEKLSGCCGGLMVKDGIAKPKSRCMTIPIMTYGALLKLNRHIYHPVYNWHFCDNELYENLDALKILKEARGPHDPVFQHRHWTVNGRPKDSIDQAQKTHPQDEYTFKQRMRMPIEERLE